MSMLAGKTALVTGAGRGIGRGIALALAKAGAKVVVNDLGVSLSGEGTDKQPAAQVADEIVQEGGSAAANFGSVAEPDDASAMVRQVVDTWGRLDILVHVAGMCSTSTSRARSTRTGPRRSPCASRRPGGS